MTLALHGVFLAYLGLLLAWNLFAQRARAEGARHGGLAGTALLVLQVLLVAVLVRDRVAAGSPSLLGHPLVAAAFPAAFVLALAQNLGAMRARGARLTDIPVVLCNVGLGACVASAALALHGRGGDPVLLYDHSVLQHLLGSHLAHVSTLSWHLPVLVRRRDAGSVAGAVAGLTAAAFCGFVVLMLVLFHREARAVLASFDTEPSAAVRDGLAVGVLERRDLRARGAAAPPGRLAVWELPADHDGLGLERDARPLVVLLRAPDDWQLARPEPEEVRRAFLDGAERLASVLRPEVLAPFPEPDGEAPLLLGGGLPPETWRAIYAEAAARVHAVSRDTRLAARLGGTGPGSRLLYEALARPPAVVEICGPRLHPGSSAQGGPALADSALESWADWRAAHEHPPALWILGAGVSPLAVGERAQARFLDGCLARASRREEVEGLVILSWRDRGGTQGLLGPGGRPREAADLIERRLDR